MAVHQPIVMARTPEVVHLQPVAQRPNLHLARSPAMAVDQAIIVPLMRQYDFDRPTASHALRGSFVAAHRRDLVATTAEPIGDVERGRTHEPGSPDDDCSDGE